jgi:methionyl-tRNA formyltransferase
MRSIEILQDGEASVKYMERSPRVLFLGMQGNFSWPALRALLKSGIEVCAVVLPAPQRPKQPAIYRREQPAPGHSTLPMLNSSLHSGIVQLVGEHQIPLWEVSRIGDPEAVSILAAYRPDVICVACFSLHIPRAILDIPRLGCLNVHPSLLPANRGPLPLFWALRQGLQQSGVTIHFMDEGMDTGDMLAQSIIEIMDGMSYAELELQCAMRGGEMLAQAVRELYEGRVHRVAQDESKSSYQSFPEDEDYLVPVAEWSASHVYNFICGVAEWGGPIKLRVGNEYFAVRQAISYSLEDISDAPSETYCWRGEELWIRCKVGWVSVVNPAAFQ